MAASPAHNKLYVFGGCGSTGRLNDLWCFDMTSSTWTEHSTSETVPARGGSVLVASADGSRLYLMGGFNGAELQDCHVFNTNTGKCSCPSCCFSSSQSSQPASAGETASSINSIGMPIGRSVFGAVLHGSRQAATHTECSSQCKHHNHVLTFGGEVSPSDKGHACEWLDVVDIV